MQKTKLGISICMVCAGVCFTAFWGGWIATILLVGYILLFEENEWLRYNSVKAFATMVLFAVLASLISLIPDFLSWIGNIVAVFDGNFNYEIVTKIFRVLSNLVSLVEKIVFLVMGMKAFKMGSLYIPVVEGLLNKYMR